MHKALLPLSLSSVMCLLGFKAWASPLKADEAVQVFNTAAYWDAAAERWQIPLHSWVYEWESDSLWRRLVSGGIANHLQLSAESVERERLVQRLGWWLVDNERNKNLRFRVGEQVAESTASRANGHSYGLLALAVPLTAYEQTAAVRVQLELPPDDAREFAGLAYLVPPRGVSVISDIDDTVKVSQVADRKALLSNVFVNEFKAVPGMAALYQAWAEAGVSFHYVSGSPWQLYPTLQAGFAAQGLPNGSFHLRHVRFKDRSAFNLRKEALEYKTPLIELLLQRYPQRQFVFVGDTTEQDPEVYALLAARYPEQVLHIYLRQPAKLNSQENAESGPVAELNIAERMAAVAAERWTLFTGVEQIEASALALVIASARPSQVQAEFVNAAQTVNTNAKAD